MNNVQHQSGKNVLKICGRNLLFLWGRSKVTHLASLKSWKISTPKSVCLITWVKDIHHDENGSNRICGICFANGWHLEALIFFLLVSRHSALHELTAHPISTIKTPNDASQIKPQVPFRGILYASHIQGSYVPETAIFPPPQMPTFQPNQ